MERLLQSIDETAGIESAGVVRMLERAVFVFLVLTAVSAPHSIAATQIAWLIGLAIWLVRIFLRPRISFRPAMIDYLLWGFLAWSILSAAVSYAPDISIDKLRVVSLFLILYFAYHNIRTARAARFIASALIFSSMAAVLWTPIERVIGRGVQIYDFQGSPFEQVALDQGDTILEIDGRKVSTLGEIAARIDRSKPKFSARIYHSDAYLTIEIPTERINASASAEESLSVRRWQKGRAWRAAGFYGHYTTFAEVLQLIMSLTLGIFASLAISRDRTGDGRMLKILGFCLAAMSFALILTATRASQAAFFLSAALIVTALGNRRFLMIAGAVLLPLALVGLIVLQQTRGVGFLDQSDNSTTWRQTVYREGVGLWTASPRNFIVGVGMDSVKRYAKEWRLFDDGRLPMGHFHSTPLQIAVERGLPALLLWIGFVGLALRKLWQGRGIGTVTDRGIILGILGGTVGFTVSGLVHYNLGDSEVAMAFFLLLGIGFALIDKIGANE